MQDAAQLVTLSLKLNNETLLAEASKAADRAGYALIEFNDERGPRVLALQEKPEAKRGRGAFFFRRDHYDGRLIVVSPHALLDDDTGQLGYECFARIPGADAFFLSGAQSSYNDQTHAESSIFNTVFAAAIGPRAVCLGVHGFDEKKPGRDGAFIEFTTVSDLPTWELFYRYGNNAALVNQQQMKHLRLRAGTLVLLRHGDRHAVSRIYPYAGPNDRITMPGAVRRRLGVQPGANRVQLSRLPN